MLLHGCHGAFLSEVDRQRSSVPRRSEVVAVGDWRAGFERRTAAGRHGRASSGEQEEAARV